AVADHPNSKILPRKSWPDRQSKSLAQSDKSHTRGKATKETEPPMTGIAMKRCAQCHGKLGLGVRSSNLWNGRWWAHTRFCSAHCEGKCELERYNANAKQHRWYTSLYLSSPQS